MHELICVYKEISVSFAIMPNPERSLTECLQIIVSVHRRLIRFSYTRVGSGDGAGKSKDKHFLKVYVRKVRSIVYSFT